MLYRVVVFLTVCTITLIPTIGAAQDAQVKSSQSSNHEKINAKPESIPVKSQTPEQMPETWEPFDGSTIGWQIAGGLGLATVGMLGGGIGGCYGALALNKDTEDEVKTCSQGFLITGLALSLTLGTLGVYGIGEGSGGDASYIGTFFAGILGAGLGFGMVVALNSAGKENNAFLTYVAALPAAAIATSIYGYHLSARSRLRDKQKVSFGIIPSDKGAVATFGFIF